MEARKQQDRNTKKILDYENKIIELERKLMRVMKIKTEAGTSFSQKGKKDGGNNRSKKTKKTKRPQSSGGGSDGSRAIGATGTRDTSPIRRSGGDASQTTQPKKDQAGESGVRPVDEHPKAEEKAEKEMPLLGLHCCVVCGNMFKCEEPVGNGFCHCNQEVEAEGPDKQARLVFICRDGDCDQEYYGDWYTSEEVESTQEFPDDVQGWM
jgi:hypothetical protein